MHELSIAINIVEIACEEAARQGDLPVESVHLRLGVDAGVVQEALLFSWPMACCETPIEGAKLILEETPGSDLQVTAIVVLENDPAPR